MSVGVYDAYQEVSASSRDTLHNVTEFVCFSLIAACLEKDRLRLQQDYTEQDHLYKVLPLQWVMTFAVKLLHV